jgi:hypothetical protein
MTDIDPVPAIYDLYGNNMQILQEHRIAAAKRCTDSCNRIQRNYGYINTDPFKQCYEKCQEMANTIINYEQQPYDSVLYNYQGYWGSYGNYGDYYFNTGNKELSLNKCLQDCSQIANPSDRNDCSQNCRIDQIALRNMDIQKETFSILEKTEGNSNLIQLFVIIVVLMIAIYYITK